MFGHFNVTFPEMFERQITKTRTNFYKRFPLLKIRHISFPQNKYFVSIEKNVFIEIIIATRFQALLLARLVTIVAKKKAKDCCDVSGQMQTNSSPAIFAKTPFVLSTIVEIMWKLTIKENHTHKKKDKNKYLCIKTFSINIC